MDTPTTTTHKTCSGTLGCGELLLLSSFSNNKANKDGKVQQCKACQRAYRKSPKGIQARRISDERYRNKPTSRFKKYIRSAASRGYTFELTFKQFMVFWREPCTHCGNPIETIGLDRIDSDRPYTRDNVESCCRVCNAMKSDTNTLAWYAHMHKIIKHVETP